MRGNAPVEIERNNTERNEAQQKTLYTVSNKKAPFHKGVADGQTATNPTRRLGSMTLNQEGRSSLWVAHSKVNAHSVEFNLDPGTDVTAIPLPVFRLQSNQYLLEY